MDLFSSQLSPVSDPEVPALLTIPSYPSRIVKTESMNVWPLTEPRPYTPQVIDHCNLDNYGCPPTYLSLNPAEVESAPFPFMTYDYKPSYFRMEDELFINVNKDEGYVSPTASLQSLTPPSDLRQFHVADSANESGNSNDLTGLCETADHLSESSPSQPPRTQCVKCGSVVDIAQCLKEATGHYLCFNCHLQSHPTEEPAQKRTRKKQSAVANARNQICQNCGCPNTTLWRRSFSGEAVCNACGLYEKLHKRKRPKSMRKDTIQTRRRKPRNVEAKKKAESSVSISNEVISQPMVIPSQPPPSHPPPSYNNRYITIEENYLPSISGLGFFQYDANYGHFSGQ